MLYPLKFNPLLKERIWGGEELSKFGKKLPAGKKIGESWELSGVSGDISVVSEGALKGNNLQELIEIYMGDLLGDRVYATFGEEFPLLVKLIDAQDFLSIQVHPDDELSKSRHGAYGKTEMWYVVDNQPGAELFLGFNQEVDKQKYMEYLERGELDQLLTRFAVSKDSAYFIPAGAIHAIGKGILVAEIQQTSDVTYRVFDFNRVDDQGKSRELHTELALDAISYVQSNEYDVTTSAPVNHVAPIATCQYFQTNSIEIDGGIEREYADLDSFVIYVCLDGELTIETEKTSVSIKTGETVLIPAVITNLTLKGKGKLLESYIPKPE
ncbi:MAG: type I phosphomannose isomerase catalytic subunit [Rikenellaceae bacterium]